QKLFDGVYDHLSKLRSDTLQVEFTGDPFQGPDQQDSGAPPGLRGFLAARVILPIVFRTVGATALPLASAAAALTAGLGLTGMLSHIMSVSKLTTPLSALLVVGGGGD